MIFRGSGQEDGKFLIYLLGGGGCQKRLSDLFVYIFNYVYTCMH